MSELETLTTQVHLLETNIEECGTKVEKIHSMIRSFKFDKEKAAKRFFSLREALSPKINIF